MALASEIQDGQTETATRPNVKPSRSRSESSLRIIMREICQNGHRINPNTTTTLPPIDGAFKRLSLDNSARYSRIAGTEETKGVKLPPIPPPSGHPWRNRKTAVSSQPPVVPLQLHGPFVQMSARMVIDNDSAIGCQRLPARRNALADPHRMLMRQATREKLQADLDKRKRSVTRKISMFFKRNFDEVEEDDLI